jgi:hypothetical protein
MGGLVCFRLKIEMREPNLTRVFASLLRAGLKAVITKRHRRKEADGIFSAVGVRLQGLDLRPGSP